ncbi:peptidase dimerization domain-containing protein [Aquincola tertiaricarbonis]|uniref:Peptidase dimerization domain-containing protein n=1 Tax=Aquincola tertiaricarbonis TaxID=391953 RepID=A0ABY4S3L8_AQUTE|nr:peptidase dimerization domain-containing protein [Aquincola tertiaricarbonis]URI08048.1 peptidase dimerization domain-containing protein [Aquincola tertiaricarbonis]
MKKTIASLLAVAAVALQALPAAAQQSGSLLVEFQGPGGHSNGAYGRTSAVHAAGRSLAQLKAAGLPAGAYSVTGLGGGNSVNSIASDARYTVQLTATDAAAWQAMAAQVTAAVQAGVAAENAFRGVKEGDLVGGVPAAIRYTITPR